jgi:membrane protein implicated in regulation of membrane protease activity
MRLLFALILIAFSGSAFAYIGPGAGVSFLGSIWAVLIGIVLAVAAVLIWPIRYVIRRMRNSANKAKGPTTPPAA